MNYDNFLREHQDLQTNNLIQDINEARIDYCHNLIPISFCLDHTLIMYFWSYQLPQSLSESGWKFFNEAEAMFPLSKDVSQFVQWESLLNATFGTVIEKYFNKRLSSNKVIMIDVSKLQKIPCRPRLNIDV